MTLQALSHQSGVSVSSQSKIEKGHTSGSIDTILKITRGLGVLFDDLLDSHPLTGVGSGPRTVTKRPRIEKYSSRLYDYEVPGELTQKKMIPLVMGIKTRTMPKTKDWSTQKGEEFNFVVRGAIDLCTEFYAPVRVKRSECAHFDSLMRHAFVTVREEHAVILSICLSVRLSLDQYIDGVEVKRRRR